MPILLLLFSLVYLLPSCIHASEPVRATRPLFKGVELYSWIDPTTQKWRYALVPGTNREKSFREIASSKNAAGSTTQLKAQISSLAPSESVVWRVSSRNQFLLPPQDVVADIVKLGRAVGVNIDVPGSE